MRGLQFAGITHQAGEPFSFGKNGSTHTAFTGTQYDYKLIHSLIHSNPQFGGFS
jgi:hypothetical protein